MVPTLLAHVRSLVTSFDLVQPRYSPTDETGMLNKPLKVESRLVYVWTKQAKMVWHLLSTGSAAISSESDNWLG